MARISSYPSSGALTGAEELLAARNGSTVTVSPDDIGDYVGSVINPERFGLIAGDAGGANASANSAAWSTMVNALVAEAVNTSGFFRSLPDIRFGPGTFEFDQPFDLTDGAILIAGRGMGTIGSVTTGATRLKFYNSTGIRLQATDTSGASTKDGTSHIGSAQSQIRDLSIEGNFSGAEAEYHGIHAKAQFSAVNVVIFNFAGDGLRLDADTPTVGGNVCDWFAQNLYINSCRNGVWDRGNNTSAGTWQGGTINGNRQWGILAGNLLGSTWIGFETSQNGATIYNDGVSIGAALVSYNGHQYGAISGQESGASTNSPSGDTTDNTWWYHIGTGTATGGIPAWFSGILVRAGGCVLDDSTISRNTYLGGYAEQNQGKAQISRRSLLIGGMLSQWLYQNPASSHGTPVIYGGDDLLHFEPAMEVASGSVTVNLGEGGGNVNNRIWSAIHPTVSPSGHRLTYAGFDMRLDYGGSSSNVPYLITGVSTTFQFGAASIIPHAFAPGILVVPNAGGVPSNSGRRITAETAVPTSGVRAKGDFAFNSSPGDFDPFAWRCSAGGSPGTWSTQYALTSLSITLGGQTMATAKLLGRTTASTGAIEAISVSDGLSFSSGVLKVAPAAARADSTAAALSDLVTDFNDLLAKLRTAKLLTP